ncbi:MAG: DUF362 domain-containing protein [Sedimentisphaerales bacterium]|jgi:uncharacterized protein (DUF362 family)
MSGPSKYALYRYDPGRVFDIVSKGFELFQLSQKLRQASLVMIKPNLVSDVEEYICNGSNTDINLIEAVLKYLSDFPCRVVIAESETGSKVKGRRLQRALDFMGVMALKSKYNFDVVNLTYDERKTVVLKKGLLLRKIDLGKTSLDADLIINMPKLKTHKYATITCALKNMFGCVPDPLRVIYHRNIHKAVADINSIYFDKTFVVLDGIRGMEGQGPLFGTPVDMNIVGFCDDSLVNDMVCAKIMGFDPKEIKHVELFKKYYYPAAIDNVEFAGEIRPEDVSRKFVRSHKNAFVRVEEQLMRSRTIVRILHSDFVRRHFTYHFRGIFKKLRGGSYTWYVDENNKQ